MARKTGDYHTEHIEWLKNPENAAGYLNAVQYLPVRFLHDVSCVLTV